MKMIFFVFCFFMIFFMSEQSFSQKGPSQIGLFLYDGKTNCPDNGTPILGAGGMYQYEKSGQGSLGTIMFAKVQLEGGTIANNIKNLDDVFFGTRLDFSVSSQSNLGGWISFHRFPSRGMDSLKNDSVRSQYDFSISYSGFLKNTFIKAGYVTTPNEYERKLDISGYRVGIGYEQKSGDFKLLLYGNIFYQSGQPFDTEYFVSLDWNVFGPALLRVEYGVTSLPFSTNPHFQIASGRLSVCISGDL